jgi:hypothetical protein
VFILFAITRIEYQDAKVKSNIALAKNDIDTIAKALDAYGMDNNVDPVPDFDLEGNSVISHRLIHSWSTSTVWESTRKPRKRMIDRFETYQKDSTYRMRILPAGHYLEKLLYDPFNNHGAGLYGYGGGPVTDGGLKNTWPAMGWIVTSYGPDLKPGNTGDPGGKPIEPSKAWTDQLLTVPLGLSPLTYDPTNGLISGGDIWRRGP